MRVGFWQGLSSPFRGLAYFVARPALWKYAAGAFGVNLLLFAVLLTLFFVFHRDLTDLVTPDGTPGVLRTVVGCILMAVAAAVALAACVLLGNALAAPFLEAMAGRILSDLGERPPPARGFWRALVLGIGHEFLKLAAFLVVQAAMLVLLLTPLGIIQPVIAGLWTVLFLAYDYLDYALEARGVPATRRAAVVLEHFGASLGFGTALFLILLVPLLGYLLLPVSVSGACLLVHDLGPVGN